MKKRRDYLAAVMLWTVILFVGTLISVGVLHHDKEYTTFLSVRVVHQNGDVRTIHRTTKTSDDVELVFGIGDYDIPTLYLEDSDLKTPIARCVVSYEVIKFSTY